MALQFSQSSWLGIALLLFGLSSSVLADDDPPPPFDPGDGFEGLFPVPPSLPGHVIDQGTSPFGISSVFNAPELRLVQSFTPSQSSIDWVGFVFQNSTQPSYPETPGPGFLQISLFSQLNTSSGALSGLLGVSDVVSIPLDTTQWLVFHFPHSIPLTSATAYFFHIANVGVGYPTWVGGRGQNFYPGGGLFGFLLNPFTNQFQLTSLNGSNHDLVFAEGTLTQVVPIPAALPAMCCALLSLFALARSKRSNPTAAHATRSIHRRPA